MWPWRRNFEVSPHTGLLASHMEEHGVRFFEFSWNRQSLEADIVHFHWPNEFFSVENRKQRWVVWRRLLWLAAYRAKGGVLIWTVHNLWPHDRPRRHSRRLQFFLSLLSGVIFFNRMSRELACQEHPALEKKPFALARQITYEALFVEQSAIKAISPSQPIRLGCFGLVRPYKNLPSLVAAMREIPASEASLTVSGGNFGHPQLQSELTALANGVSNIELAFRHLPLAELERFVSDCDAIILPYREIHNSGSAIFALSKARPVILPSLGALPELADVVGSEWIFYYTGDLTAERIREALTWLRRPRSTPPDMSQFSASRTAASVVNFYRLLTSG
jgi:beta-1,4-mannosyltransferase